VRFREAATGKGYADLALLAEEPPVVTGATGTIPDGVDNDPIIDGGFDGGGNGCLNPSCTGL